MRKLAYILVTITIYLLYRLVIKELDMEFPMKEVYFDEYCPKCEFHKNKETEQPCFDCLDCPVNEHSHKPVKFKEKLTKKN